jgi:TfoX/Sxy family transcriptional regulator of competence genes
MAFDTRLAERLRAQLAGVRGISERKMFGGLAFMLNGNMCCGVHAQEMIVRLDARQAEEALGDAHVRAFDLGRRPIKGWLLVRPVGLRTDAALARWARLALVHARGLPAKKK